ncbi:RED-like protein N-terminal region-domain-containing protein [Phycomyces blakesleeanus]|uniref:RED-like protein N-terminal region-domain-containing protein n=1 Tax=Phycomyces blakesleeanus TaxID=4837 RepID=A0ABR3AQ42_PHYBL
MQTPRASSNSSSTPHPSRFKTPVSKTPRDTGAVFARPEPVRKKRNERSEKRYDDDDDDEEGRSHQYRDRAAERRNEETTADEAEAPVQTMEDVLRSTLITQDSTLDAKQAYEKSKYLGGDVDHTHLVKGLDFSLLERVRTELETKRAQVDEIHREAEAENELDDCLDKIDRGESIATNEEEIAEDGSIITHTAMGRQIADLLSKTETKSGGINELFVPGRMAFVFELADEVGHYRDAFSIPTSIIRSKTDGVTRLGQTGWSEDMEAESTLVISKVSQVMANARVVEKAIETKKALAKSASSASAASTPAYLSAISKPNPMVTIDCDIFEDAGRDYQLDESTIEKSTEVDENGKLDYFKGFQPNGSDNKDNQNEDVEMKDVAEEQVSALLSQATGRGALATPDIPVAGSQPLENKNEEPLEVPSKRRRDYQADEVDADANDMDMYGLSTSALPTSFEDRQRTVAYDGTSDDDENEGTSVPTSLVDQGTHRNKKAQLTRWDFDNEEEWQKYKDTVEIYSKSAFQFGVKLGDGRKRNRERRGMNDKQKLDRDYQQVKNLMDKKYGKS